MAVIAELIEKTFPECRPGALATAARAKPTGRGWGRRGRRRRGGVAVVSVYVYEPVSGAMSQKFTVGGSIEMEIATKLNDETLPMSALLTGTR